MGGGGVEGRREPPQGYPSPDLGSEWPCRLGAEGAMVLIGFLLLAVLGLA